MSDNSQDLHASILLITRSYGTYLDTVIFPSFIVCLCGYYVHEFWSAQTSQAKRLNMVLASHITCISLNP